MLFKYFDTYSLFEEIYSHPEDYFNGSIPANVTGYVDDMKYCGQEQTPDMLRSIAINAQIRSIGIFAILETAPLTSGNLTCGGTSFILASRPDVILRRKSRGKSKVIHDIELPSQVGWIVVRNEWIAFPMAEVDQYVSG